MLVLHAINKTGCISLSHVISNITSELSCFDRSRNILHLIGDIYCRENLFAENNHTPSCSLLIDHNLMGFDSILPNPDLIKYGTLIREPAKRMCSIFGWINKHHPKALRSTSLRDFVNSEEFGYYLQYPQIFTNYFSDDISEQIIQHCRKSNIEVMARLDDFAYIGVTDYFEISIVNLFHYLNLPAPSVWPLDNRNKDWRTSLSDSDIEFTRKRILTDYPQEYHLYYTAISKMMRYTLANSLMNDCVSYEVKVRNCPDESRIAIS
jgi:hypothetical protein